MSNPQTKPAYQAFQILEPMTTAPEDVQEFARGFVDKAMWTFARTMPEAPHWYTLRRNCYADGFEDEFVRMVELIREHGYRGRFHKTRLIYMNVDNYRYWSMGAPIRHYAPGDLPLDERGRPSYPVDETILINRALNDDLPVPCCNLSIATGGKHHARSCRNHTDPG